MTVAAAPFAIASAPGDLRLPHIFNFERYSLLQPELRERGFVSPDRLLRAAPAPREDLLLVHTPEWVAALERGLTAEQTARAEIDWSPAFFPLLQAVVGGSILAVGKAIDCGAAFHIGGGFHHAFAGHGEGFCLVNDIAVAIRKARLTSAIARVMVVDVDAHQGNGTAAIFEADDDVFTYSIHEENNYPMPKARSSVDVGLESNCGDARYLARLQETCTQALDSFRPELIVYVAGSDPYSGDRLARLGVSKEGLRERDRFVFRQARARGVPCAVVMGGGYAMHVMSTVLIYFNTFAALAESYRGA